MRVLHVAPDISRAFGGPTMALLGFVAAARTAGIEVEIAAPAPPADDLAWFREHAGDTPLRIYPTRGRGSARLSRAMLASLRDRRDAFDVVHVHGMFNAISSFAALTCRRLKIPYVIGPFGTLSRYTFEHRRRLLKRAYHALLDARAIRGAAAMHFTTVQERDEARRLPAVASVPAAVVPPPWVPDRRAGDGNGASHGMQDGADGETVLFLSRLHPIKGLETLIDAWPAVRAQRPSARLVIAGAGSSDYERTLRERASRSEASESIRFTGFVTGAEKARWLGEADVFVLPSHHENFGVAVLEAIAAGVPAVISPEVQLAGVVEEHRLGTVVPREPERLARGILDALDDDAMRLRLATEGRGIVRSLFTPESVGAALRAMYEMALRPAPRPREGA